MVFNPLFPSASPWATTWHFPEGGAVLPLGSAMLPRQPSSHGQHLPSFHRGSRRYKKFLAWDKRLEVSDKVNHPLRWIPAPAPVLGGRTGCFLHPRFHSPPNLMPCPHFPPGASRSPLGSEPQVSPFGGCCQSPLSSQLLGTRLGSGSSNTIQCQWP